MLKRLTDRTTTLGYEGLALRLGLCLSLLMPVLEILPECVNYYFRNGYWNKYGQYSVLLSILGILASILISVGYRTRLLAILTFVFTTGWIIFGIETCGRSHHFNHLDPFTSLEHAYYQIPYMGIALILYIYGGGHLSLDELNSTPVKPISDKLNISLNSSKDLPAALFRATLAIPPSLEIFFYLYNMWLTSLAGFIYRPSVILLALVIAGLFTRTSALILAVLVIYKYVWYYQAFGSWFGLDRADVVAYIFLLAALIITGPGRYSVDRWIITRRAAKAGG